MSKNKISQEAKETVELLDAIFSLTDGVRASLADDGKITLIDIGNFIGPLTKLPLAIAGIESIPSELSKLSAAGRVEVLDYFAERFDLADDLLEARIEAALATGYEFANAVLALAKYKRAA